MAQRLLPALVARLAVDLAVDALAVRPKAIFEQLPAGPTVSVQAGVLRSSAARQSRRAPVQA